MARDACHKCHDASYTAEKYMPNTGKTADNLFVLQIDPETGKYRQFLNSRIVRAHAIRRERGGALTSEACCT